ncbi:family 78 glycoside hydrolase catalytic domain [Phocaeicola plebeius]|uniref:family 78 glycoside hydrolase catalytic domain n=2 Tax=Pseudomonadati TaxID=3379134 RepID=UPI0026EB880D|nr:family 78 glycoside hydrolase catalytic domain [Phocaeicola plebeius]
MFNFNLSVKIYRSIVKIFRIILFTFCIGFILISCGKSSKEVFRIDSLNDSCWQSSLWISVANAPVVKEKVYDGTRAADGTSWFMSTVKNDKKVSRALWMTTGLGVYEIYVNGKLVGDEILKPGFTHYEKTKLSFTYDVTGCFKTASGDENVLSAQVTPGWWADKIITPGGHDGMIGKKCAFRGVLELTYTDGSKELYGTNIEDWKAGIAGPVTHAAIFDGEEYDARIPLGYETPEKLSTPEVNNEFKGEIFPSDGAEVYFRQDLSLAPVNAYIWESVEGKNENDFGKIVIKRKYNAGEPMEINPGENLVIDFGQNTAAVPSFIFSAAEGTVLNCVTSELLNDGNGAKDRGMDGPEGSVHRLNLRIPDTGMKLKYIFADSEGDVNYTPRCTFFGYRFISINVSDKVVIKDIKSLPVTSISKEMEIGCIKTGNELVNKLISNTLWGQRSNYLSIPTDCPQRNERLGWTADTQVFAETGSFFANTSSFFHKWMRDLIDSQGETGGFPGVAPLSQYGNDMTRLGWSDAGVIVPWTIWKQFGDKEIVELSWDAMEKYMSHINETRYDHNTLIGENGNYQWADWLSYEPLESCGGSAFDLNGPLPEAIEYWNYLSASYWLLDASMMRDMAIGTGRDASIYESMILNAKNYIRDKFFTLGGKFKTDILNTMQTPALFALKNGIFEGKIKDDIIFRLRENFEKHGNCLQTGFLGTSILMPTLTENGMSDIAWNLLFQRKNPSWLYSIDNGATTIWERWNSYMLDQGMGPRGMNSFNHYAYGVVCEWIWETAAGISSDPVNPGFKHIIMKPIPDKRLGSIEAVYNSVSGTIKSSWRYEGDKWIWEFSIPDGCTASVTIPGESESREYISGDYKIVR